MAHHLYFQRKKQLLDFDTSQSTKYKAIIGITKRVLINIMDEILKQHLDPEEDQDLNLDQDFDQQES